MRGLLAAVFLLVVGCLFVVDGGSLAPLAGDTATLQRAAEAFTKTLQEKQKGTYKVADVSVQAVQVMQGMHKRVSVEVDGEPHNFLLADEPQWQSLTDLLPSGQDDVSLLRSDQRPTGGLEALVSAAELAPFTLVGPLEIVFTQPVAVDMQLPHRVDAGMMQRVLLEEGAAVEVHGAQAVRLRRPLDLPELPRSFLANVFGVKLQDGKVPTQGPLSGMLHFASGLWQRARAWRAGDHPPAVAALVSLELDMGGATGARLVSAPPAPGEPAPRLKVRRPSDHTVELVVRDLQVRRGSSSSPQGTVGTPWAWPLPGIQLGDLQRYEELLRETLARQPRGIKSRLPQGLSLRLVESMTDAVTVLKMELEVERDWGNSPEVRWEGLEIGRSKYELWRALVMLRKGTSSLQYIPLHADLVDAPHSTVSFSPMAELMAHNNMTIPDRLELVYPTFGW